MTVSCCTPLKGDSNNWFKAMRAKVVRSDFFFNFTYLKILFQITKYQYFIQIEMQFKKQLICFYTILKEKFSFIFIISLLYKVQTNHRVKIRVLHKKRIFLLKHFIKYFKPYIRGLLEKFTNKFDCERTFRMINVPAKLFIFHFDVFSKKYVKICLF